tara:strand:+ start:107 stop:1090 length:984 start_codon:yes stop_codon:yes gene_type:complete
MANIDTLNGPIAETPGEQVDVQDAFADVFPEAHDANSSNEQPQVAPHPAQNQSIVEEPVEQPVQENPVQSSNATNIDNEERRYQYWQSQAAKMKNEMERQQAEFQQYAPAIEYLKNNPQAMQPGQFPQNTNIPEDTFPSAPDKPKKPRSFNRADALEDPKSESARYLDELDDWQDEMENYNALLTEYNSAKMNEQMQQFQQQQQDMVNKQNAYAQQQQQMNAAKEYVVANYGATAEDAEGFVKHMSDDSSINMDNLWKLYQITKGQPVDNSTAPAPSPAFQQTQRAQQVPSPMGVIPSQNTQATAGSQEDNIMDSLISAHKAKNPWS